MSLLAILRILGAQRLSREGNNALILYCVSHVFCLQMALTPDECEEVLKKWAEHLSGPQVGQKVSDAFESIRAKVKNCDAFVSADVGTDGVDWSATVG